MFWAPAPPRAARSAQESSWPSGRAARAEVALGLSGYPHRVRSMPPQIVSDRVESARCGSKDAGGNRDQAQKRYLAWMRETQRDFGISEAHTGSPSSASRAGSGGVDILVRASSFMSD